MGNSPGVTLDFSKAQPITLDFSKAQPIQGGGQSTTAKPLEGPFQPRPGETFQDVLFRIAQEGNKQQTSAPKQYLPGRQFGMDVARGMGLDADKIRAAEDAGGQGEALKEIGRQVFEGLTNFTTSVAKDPLNVDQPFQGMASALVNALGLPDKGSALDTSAYHAPNPGQVVGATANILGGAEGEEAAGRGRVRFLRTRRRVSSAQSCVRRRRRLQQI